MDLWLRSRAPRPAPPPRTEAPPRQSGRQMFLVDLLLAVPLAVVAIAVQRGTDAATLPASATAPDGVLDWLIVIGPAWMVPFRRLTPLSALAIGAALQMTVWTIGHPDTFVASAVLLYSASVHTVGRRRSLVWAIAALLSAYTGLGVLTGNAPAYVLPLIGLFSVAAVAFGGGIAARQAYAEAAEARALELERSRQSDGERALAEERARIARELHDVVAHGLSVIVVQAAAAGRILERDPQGAATALHQIEQTGRNALGEMRHVLAAIRTEPEDSWQPSRGLADLDTLVDELERTGLPVTVNRTGAAPLPATVDVTAYRIVRESLTNVLKHGGPGAAAQVDIVRHPRLLELRITDNGRGALAAEGGGHGLRGMQERVEVFGGRLSAGPRLGGGFTVEVALPLDAETGPSDDPIPAGSAEHEQALPVE